MRSQGKTLLIVLLVLLVLGFVGIVAGLLLLDGPKEIPTSAKKKVIEIDLTAGIASHIPADPVARSFFDQRLELREVVEALAQAADDDRVVALLARVGAAPMGLGTIQELRDAIADFSASGKKTVAYADTFGEFGPSNGGYYLASAFERVLLQPSGDVGVTGLLYQTSFLRGTFDKLGLEPRMDHRYEYKNAMNTLTETEYTAAHEEAMKALVESQFDQILEGIASGRELELEAARELFDLGPFFGQEAVDAGLVDALVYRDEVYDGLKEEFGEDVSFQALNRYYDRDGKFGSGTTIGLIYGIGAVMRGESRYDPLTGDLSMGADTVAEAFRNAVKDPKVKAILFRVDSPGGSYVASDTIWRETVKAREAGKPVIVSMGNVAGSGGYFVAMAADSIVAQPGTITGSIGVYGGKLVSRDLFAKLGISFDSVATSANSRMWSGIDDFSERGWRRLQDSLDRIYEDFTTKVAAGREMELDKVREVAKGRIWTGSDARGLGLVDKLGGYPMALAEVRAALDLAEDADLRLKVFPRPKSAFEVFFDSFPMVATGGSWQPVMARMARAVQEVGRRLEELGLLEAEPAPLELPFVPELE